MVHRGCRQTDSKCRNRSEMKASSFRTSFASVLQDLFLPRGPLHLLLVLLFSLVVLATQSMNGSLEEESITRGYASQRQVETLPFAADVGDPSGQAGIVKKLSIWPNATIPYHFTVGPSFVTDVELYLARIREAMEWWENETCVQFRHVNESDGIDLFVNIHLKNTSQRCDATIGYLQLFKGYYNLNKIRLTPACLDNVGNIAHELGHSIGLHHEHSRKDRDNHITVHFDNILSTVTNYYIKLTVDYESWDTPYDYGSIMHYPQYSGDAVNTSQPLFTLQRPELSGAVGQRECLSYSDILITNTVYGCNLPAPIKTKCNYRFTSSTDTEMMEDPRNLILSGDVIALKINQSYPDTWNRWIGRNDNRGGYYAWGCPGPTFERKRPGRCWEFKFTITSPDVATGMPLHYDDRVIFKQCATSLECDRPNVTLTCPSNESLCVGSTAPDTLDNSENVFRVVSLSSSVTGRVEMRRLRPNNVVQLTDESESGHLRLWCNVSSSRRWQRTCQLHNITEEDGIPLSHEQNFEIFKL